MNTQTDQSIAGDNRGIIAGRDIRDSNLISIGDIEVDYAIIGDKISEFKNYVQMQSPAAGQVETKHLTRKLIAEGITRKLDSFKRTIENAQPLNNPYKNQSIYGVLDAPYYYGRKDATEKMLDHIHRDNLTLLLGPTGVGKSSLLRAGLISRILAAGHLPIRIEIPPRVNEEAPATVDLPRLIKSQIFADIATNEPLDTMPLHGFLTEASYYLDKRILYIFLDGFGRVCEEMRNDESAYEHFIKEFHTTRNDDTLPIRWIITSRDVHAPGLNMLGGDAYNNSFRLQELCFEDAYQAIIAPAKQKGVHYENGLAEQILSDLAGVERMDVSASDGIRFAPSTLQWVCYTLFDELEEGESAITYAHYDRVRGPYELSGAAGIISTYLQNRLSEFQEADQQLALHILKTLCQPLDEDEVITSLNTFLKALLVRLHLAKGSLEAEHVRNILDQLIDKRLVMLKEIPTAEGSRFVYDLTHDFLIHDLEGTVSSG